MQGIYHQANIPSAMDALDVPLLFFLIAALFLSRDAKCTSLQ
jgi:hypothetical protein